MTIECLECNSQCWVSFQLVDESGSGKAYAGLAYVLTDTEGNMHKGQLDANGASIKHNNIPCGGVILSFCQLYQGNDRWYRRIMIRGQENQSNPYLNYALPITQFQYAAEQTQWLQEWSKTIQTYPNGAIKHHQLEVRDFVEQVMHLPVYKTYTRTSTPKFEWTIRQSVLGSIPPKKRAHVPQYGVGLESNKKHILEIKALRAFRPKLSLEQNFSALNLYQLSFLTAMAYTNFNCFLNKPTNYMLGSHYKANGASSYGNGIGAVLVNEWAQHKESGFYGKAQSNQKYAMILEDVPYSKRFEVVPFDPDLYPQNKWDRRISTPEKPLPWNAVGRQETPDSVHFFDDSMLGYFSGKGTETQGFLTHNDEVLIVSIRGTQEFKDFLTDANAEQVSIVDYKYKAKAHKGFHRAYAAIKPFIKSYLDRFHVDQKIIVVGHSLGGAIATLVAEWIRQQPQYTQGNNSNVILYTYGSPRVGNVDFLANAQITHHRMVAENDPIPSVPGTWLTNSTQALILGGFGKYMAVKVFDDNSSSLYSHQGELYHFTNLALHSPKILADELMWKPGCMGVQQCSKALALDAQLPNRANFGKQLLNMSDHFMFNSYIPFSYATLKRWRNSLDKKVPVVSSQEVSQLKTALSSYRKKLDELSYGFDDVLKDMIPVYGSYRQVDRVITKKQLNEEAARIDQDLQRANTLAKKIITRNEFYGKDVAGDKVIETIYSKWVEKDKKYRRPQDLPTIQS